MAIDAVQWKMIQEAGLTGKALSAGYPDLLVELKDLPKKVNAVRELRRDSAAVAKHHGWPYSIYDTCAVFEAMGLELFVIDRDIKEGSEQITDLNIPQDLGEYELVIDPGTSEHCFNIAQSLVNLAGAVKVGGCISQALPMAMFNHGYWNVNPVALVDFYEANGFRVETMVIRHKEGVFDPKPEDRGRRLKGVPDGSVNVLLARRLEKKPFTWPQQKL